MSTNYYAVLEIGPNIVWKLHIGKASASGMSTLCGMFMPTAEAWRMWLRHQTHQVRLEDEYGRSYGTEEFISDLLTTPGSESQINWLRRDNATIHEEPQAVNYTSAYWIDGEGFLVYSGEFS